MKYTLLSIFLFGITTVCTGQYYQSRCDLIETCGYENSFTESISERINRLNSDTILVVATYGGVGCRTSDLVIFYRKKGLNKVEFYKNTKRQKGKEFDSEYVARLESFFTKKLYLTTDTVANKYLYIDDGASHTVLYRAGDKCGTYHFFPEYSENSVYDWILGVRYPRTIE